MQQRLLVEVSYDFHNDILLRDLLLVLALVFVISGCHNISDHKIGDYNKHQTILSPGNVKARKAKVIYFMQGNIFFEKSKN